MPRADWRSPAAYEDKRALDAPGFAFEFLCRNKRFQRDHQRLVLAKKRGKLSQSQYDAFARKWGIRFRGGSSDGAKSCHLLDAICAAKHHGPDGNAGGLDAG